VDGETTGLDVKRDRLLSLGALRLVGHTIRLQDQFERYLPQEDQRVNDAAIAIHGIIPNSRRLLFTTEEDLLREFLDYMGRAPIVGHHIGFDLAILNGLLERNGCGPLVNPWIDTADLAQRIVPKGYWRPDTDYSLDALAKRYRISLSDRHTALGDCYITAVLWLKLLTRLAEKRHTDLRFGDVFLLPLSFAVLLFALFKTSGSATGEAFILVAGVV
jgi:DNA polymerase-3 subunit epsilon